MFDVSFHSAVFLAHVIAGVWLVGGSLFAPYIRRAILAAPSVESLLGWLDFGRRSSAINPLMAFVLLGSGIYLGSAGFWSQGWFYVAAVSWLIDTLVVVLVIQRSAAGLAKAAAQVGQGPITPQLDALRRSRAWDLGEQVMWASDLGMLYVMYMKPSALESCLVIGVLFASSFAVHAIRERRAEGGAAATANS